MGEGETLQPQPSGDGSTQFSLCVFDTSHVSPRRTAETYDTHTQCRTDKVVRTQLERDKAIMADREGREAGKMGEEEIQTAEWWERAPL